MPEPDYYIPGAAFAASMPCIYAHIYYATAAHATPAAAAQAARAALTRLRDTCNALLDQPDDQLVAPYTEIEVDQQIF